MQLKGIKKKFLLVFSCLLLTSCGPSPYKQITDAASSPQVNQPTKESQGSKCITTTISGSGTDVIDVSDQAGCRFVTASCDGDSNFIIKAYNYQGERIEGIVNEICGEDGYRWRKMWNPDRENYEYIEVDADGGWSLDIN